MIEKEDYLYDIQRNIELKYNKRNIHEIICKDISDGNLNTDIIQLMFEISSWCRKYYYESKNKRLKVIRDIKLNKFVIDCLAKIASIGTSIVPIQAISAKIGSLLYYEDEFDGIKTAAELLVIFSNAEFIDIIPAQNSETGSLMVQSNISLGNDTIKYINTTGYIPPMLVPPRKLQKNTSSGYLTIDNTSVILGKGNNHKDYINLMALNTASGVAFSLDYEILDIEEHLKKPETRQQVLNNADFIKSSNEIYELIACYGNKFYFTWKYDKRGRMYSQGYEVNIQSMPYKKAMINLYEKHIITK